MDAAPVFLCLPFLTETPGLLPNICAQLRVSPAYLWQDPGFSLGNFWVSPRPLRSSWIESWNCSDLMFERQFASAEQMRTLIRGLLSTIDRIGDRSLVGDFIRATQQQVCTNNVAASITVTHSKPFSLDLPCCCYIQTRAHLKVKSNFVLKEIGIFLSIV